MAPPRPSISPAVLRTTHTYQHPSKLLVTEYTFSVALEHASPKAFSSRKLNIFCRIAEKYENPVTAPSKDEDKTKDTPILVYIPGGPGFGCPQPQDLGMTHFILEKGYKLLCFDHRGMGLSSPVTAETLAKEGDIQQQAQYLTYFRAPHAVMDLEAIRLCLTKDHEDEARKKWSIMGSSYGGFVCTTYLSMYPHGLREVFNLAGLPPVLQTNPDNVIRQLIPKIKERNDVYYKKYPSDVAHVRRIVDYLASYDKGGVDLPDGGLLTPQRFLEMGFHFGFHGGLDEVHDAVLRASRDIDQQGFLTRPTLGILSRVTWYDEHIIYALLHEALYCQGAASNWSFDRILSEFTEFRIPAADGQIEQGKRLLFTGEMVFSHVYTTYPGLAPLKAVATALQQKDDWCDLYDVAQLAHNRVPTYAAVYLEDMYVGFGYAMETARLIANCKALVTNQFYHDAIRAKATDVLAALWALREDSVD